MHPLIGIWAKIERAEGETERLRSEIRAFFSALREGDAYRIVPETDPKTREEVHRIVFSRPLPTLAGQLARPWLFTCSAHRSTTSSKR